MGRKISIIAGIAFLAVLVTASLAFSGLKRHARIADIISDERAWDIRDSVANAAVMRVVHLQDGHVARVVDEDDSTYVCSIQDTFSIPKDGAKVELWSAVDGKGIVFLKHPGTLNAYSKPDRKAAVVLELKHEEGYVPEIYPCLGLVGEWFKIGVRGKTAYVEAVRVSWDAIDTF